MMRGHRGFLIVLEGGDRSGKSTQCEFLVASLNKNGYETVSKKFPDRKTPTGKIISEYLQNGIEMDQHAIHLLFSANRWEAMKEYRALLESGKNVIVDRYAYSGFAFSVANGLDAEWCLNSDKGLLSPDLVMYLDLDPEVAKLRGNYGEERYESVELQAKVRRLFLSMSKKDTSWKVINADMTPDSLHETIHALTMNLLSSTAPPLQSNLWMNMNQ